VIYEIAVGLTSELYYKMKFLEKYLLNIF